MGLTLVAPLREGAPESCLQALVNDLAVFGCHVRIDAERHQVICKVPFGSLTWALHGGFAGVLRPYAACVALDASAVGRPRRRRPRHAPTAGGGA
jgi:hypothetical protein